MPDHAVVVSSAADDYNKAVLAYLVGLARTEVKFGKLSGGMDVKEAVAVMETMDSSFIRGAIVKFLFCNGDFDEASELDCVKNMFTHLFEGIDDEARKRFMDAARGNWHGYGEVTDEMIEEDLKQRAEKSNKNK